MTKHWKQSLGLLVGSWILFAAGVTHPHSQVYDEFHYVPASKNLISKWANTNWEHPPLAKWIMGAGIAIFGDNSLGWRAMSTIFGALTILGMYAWAMAVFRKKSIALWVALLAIGNQMVYVQARIGMLDTFMVAFMVWGMAAWTQTIRDSKAPTWIAAFGGACFGMSVACKWYGVIPWFFCLGGAVGLYVLGMAKVPWKTWLFAGLILPFVIYAATYLPQLTDATGPLDLAQRWMRYQTDMYAGQLRVVDTHSYMSQWTSWPWMTRPIWYAFERDQSWVRCVIMMGNPLIIWGGLVAVLMLIPDLWSRPKSFVPLWILLSYGAFYFCWGVIPRKIAFFYYYYPAALVLHLALAHLFYSREKSGAVYFRRPSFWFLTLSTLMFIYFFPILSGIRIAPEAFRQWMWFRSWI